MRRGRNTIEDEYAEACFRIEKDLGQTITPEYPASKFYAQLNEIKKDYKKQKKEMDKQKPRGKR